MVKKDNKKLCTRTIELDEGNRAIIIGIVNEVADKVMEKQTLICKETSKMLQQGIEASLHTMREYCDNATAISKAEMSYHKKEHAVAEKVLTTKHNKIFIILSGLGVATFTLGIKQLWKSISH